MTVLCILAAFLCFLYCFIVFRIRSGNRFYLIWALGGLFFIGLAVMLRYELWGRFPLLLRRGIVGLIAFGLVLFVIAEGCIFAHYRDRGRPDLDYIIVLGAQMKPAGPSVVLKFRLDAAYDYLVANGADGERLWMEGNSRNTWQNVNYTLELMEEKDLNAGNGVVLVSSGFHLTRIKMLWSRAGGTANVSTLAAPTSSLYTTVHMFFREPLALVKSFVFDR